MSKRASWATTAGFILAAVGSAVGLGNIWRFSYMAYRSGGGAFLIPYISALFIIGFPILLLEFALGHWRKGSAPKAFYEVNEKWEWLGWWAVCFIMFGIVIYYSVIISWSLNYFFFSFDMRWADNPDAFFFQDFLQRADTIGELGAINVRIAAGAAFIWFVCWFICFRGVAKGIEKANKLFMPVLFVLTLILVGWTFYLPESREGFRYYLEPDFSRLTDIEIWISAVTQNFFTLSIGFGIMIAYASYLPKKVSMVKYAFVVSLLDHGYSIVVGFAVFGVLGYMAAVQNVPIDEVVTAGIGLAFVALPEAISTLPFGAFNRLFGVIFFFCLVIAGISSAISIIEAFTSSILDKFHFHRRHVVSVLALIGFAGTFLFTNASGLFFLDIIDHFINNYGLLTVGILECLIIGWWAKDKLLINHIVKSSPASDRQKYFLYHFLSGFWSYCIRFLCPLVLIIIFVLSLRQDVTQPYEDYPVVYLILMGVGCLIITHIIGFFFSRLRWKEEPAEDYWDES